MANTVEVLTQIEKSLKIDPCLDGREKNNQISSIMWESDKSRDSKDTLLASLYRDIDSYGIDPDEGDMLRNSFYTYRYFLESHGRYRSGVRLAIEDFNDVSLGLGINRIALPYRGSWSSSLNFFGMVLDGFSSIGWNVDKLEIGRMILKRNA